MENNGIEDLRGLLFDTLRDLRNKEKPMEIERAKAVAEVARELISTARVEVEHMKIAGGKGSGFIPIEDKSKAPAAGQPRLVQGRDTRG
jgi:hypothetical protein